MNLPVIELTREPGMREALTGYLEAALGYTQKTRRPLPWRNISRDQSVELCRQAILTALVRHQRADTVALAREMALQNPNFDPKAMERAAQEVLEYLPKVEKSLRTLDPNDLR